MRIPRFPIGAVWRAQGVEARRQDPLSGASPELLHGGANAPSHWDAQPLVLADADASVPATRRRVKAVSAAAAKLGLRAGMKVSEARAIAGGVQVLAWDDTVIARAVTEMTARLLAASPQVTPVPGAPGLWWVGASGFDAIGGERALGHSLRRIASRVHPESRVAIADACVTARAATWAARRSERMLLTIISPGRDAQYLSTAPLALIPMEEEIREVLRALGLGTAGDLAALDAGDVERRWGPEGLSAWRLARGEDDRRPMLGRRPQVPTVEAELPLATETMEPVLFLVRAALDRLVHDVLAEGRAIAAVAITLTLDDTRGAMPRGVHDVPRAHTVTREVRPARALARTAPLFEHCRALLDRWTLTAPAIGVAVSATATAPLTGDQGDLLADTWRDPAAADAALARLRAELGETAVVRPSARDDHRPERAGAWVGEVARGGPPDNHDTPPSPESHHHSPATGIVAPREIISPALRLLDPPEPADVWCVDDTPHALAWRGRRIPLAAAAGPERLSGDWWSAGYQRDYWRCENATGEGDLLVFHDRTGDTPGGHAWFVQGWYD